MRVTFAGVGEAFDEHLSNTSILVEAGTSSILLDCGLTAAPAFWRYAAAPMDLDGVYISHFHGDHFFGLPQLLMRFIDNGRSRPLTIVGPPRIEDRIQTLMSLAYVNHLSRADFPLRFAEAVPGNVIPLGAFSCSFARTDHSAECMSIRVEHEGCAMFYSGDGRPTTATHLLAHGCALVVHEAFDAEQERPGHGSVRGAIKFAKECGARELALVHVHRTSRTEECNTMQQMMHDETTVNVLLPEPGDCVVCEAGRTKASMLKTNTRGCDG